MNVSDLVQRSALGAAATALDQLGLLRLLRLMVAGSIPPLWYEIALLHYRGRFQSGFTFRWKGSVVRWPAPSTSGRPAGSSERSRGAAWRSGRLARCCMSVAFVVRWAG